MERTQISLTSEQAERLRRIAERRGTSMAALIRDAVDRVVIDGEDPEARWARAVKVIGSAQGQGGNVSEDHDRYLAEAFADLDSNVSEPIAWYHRRMLSSKVSTKHQVSLPSAARRKLGIEAGDRLSVEVTEDAMILRRRPAKPSERLRGLGRSVWDGTDSVERIRRLRDEIDAGQSEK